MLRRTLRHPAGALGKVARTPERTLVVDPEDNYLIAPKDRIGHHIANKRNPRDTMYGEDSHRMIRPQRHFFEVPRVDTTTPRPEWAKAADHFERFERVMIWNAFDYPERIAMQFYDAVAAGRDDVFTAENLDSAMHWVREARYWRCIGLERPFHDHFTLRAAAWERNGTDVGVLRISRTMKDAIKDLELAVKRVDAGLAPNYIWDNWGPMGFTDGSRTQYLPRFRAAPVVDPDGIDVTDADIAEYTTHEQLKERYGEIINPDPEPYHRAFLTPSNASIHFEDFDEALQTRVAALRDMSPTACTKLSTVDDIRAMLYLAALPEQFDETLANATTWDEVREAVDAVRATEDIKVDAARLLRVGRSLDELKTLYEEKCGLVDFNNTSDKVLTAITLAHLEDLKAIVESGEWGPALCYASSDHERLEVMGETAFRVLRELLDTDRDHRRRVWIARFAGEANEEKALDFMLQNFARRAESPTMANQVANEFDRESEPIGRDVQRRIIDADRQITADSGIAAATDRLNEFRARLKRKRVASVQDMLKKNQMHN